MENASKALIIAGGALLVVLLFTVMNYVFGNMAESASDMYDTMSESEITEFNQKFLNYDGRGETKDSEGNPINPLNIQDVVTIVNLAKDNNERENPSMVVSVTVNGSNWTTEMDTKDLNEALITYKEKKFKCTVSYATNSTLVDSVVISQLN